MVINFIFVIFLYIFILINSKKRKEVEDPLELIKKNLAKDKELEQKIQESLPYYQRERKDINVKINISIILKEINNIIISLIN